MRARVYTVLGVARLILALQLLDHSLLFFLVKLLSFIIQIIGIAECLAKSNIHEVWE